MMWSAYRTGTNSARFFKAQLAENQQWRACSCGVWGIMRGMKNETYTELCTIKISYCGYLVSQRGKKYELFLFVDKQYEERMFRMNS